MATADIVAENTAVKTIVPDNIIERVAELREMGCTIATLNGSFDLLHAGHLQILMEAAEVADVLIVALNSDASIRSYKSSDRPIIPLNYRLQMIAALDCVDFVTWFDEDDPRMILSQIKPDVHVNGAEYGDTCIEAETVQQGGGRVHLVNRVLGPGLSTSEIIEKIGTLCASSVPLKTKDKAENSHNS